MKKRTINKLLGTMLLGAAFSMTAVHAQGNTPVVGKNDWLFTPYEFATPDDAPDTEATLQLLQKVNKLFERSGIALAVVIVIGTVVHVLLVEGAMGTMSKAAFCALVVAVTAKVLMTLRAWTLLTRRRRSVDGR